MNERCQRLKSAVADVCEGSLSASVPMDDKRFLYRGGKLEDIEREVEDGIDATTYEILSATLTRPDENFRGKRANLPTSGQMDIDKVAATGGVTGKLSETRRFAGVRGVALVLDSDMGGFPYERVEYSYDYMNDNPGVLPHILTTQDGEIRDDDGNLWGTFSEQPRVSGGRFRKVEHTVNETGGLPATSPQSMFADENEWVAAGVESVDIAEYAIGAVSPVYSDRVDIAEHHQKVSDALPVPVYTVQAPDVGSGYGMIGSASVEAAYGPNGPVDLMDVPTAFLGGDSNL
jgi:hypothetical protein